MKSLCAHTLYLSGPAALPLSVRPDTKPAGQHADSEGQDRADHLVGKRCLLGIGAQTSHEQGPQQNERNGCRADINEIAGSAGHVSVEPEQVEQVDGRRDAKHELHGEQRVMRDPVPVPLKRSQADDLFRCQQAMAHGASLLTGNIALLPASFHLERQP